MHTRGWFESLEFKKRKWAGNVGPNQESPTNPLQRHQPSSSENFSLLAHSSSHRAPTPSDRDPATGTPPPPKYPLLHTYYLTPPSDLYFAPRKSADWWVSFTAQAVYVRIIYSSLFVWNEVLEYCSDYCGWNLLVMTGEFICIWYNVAFLINSVYDLAPLVIGFCTIFFFD